MMRDALLVFRQQLRLSTREPAWLIIALIQPLLYLALFGPLLEPLTRTQGFPPGDSWQVFVPGLLIQLGMFGSLFVGFGLLGELRDGVVERMRVTPVSRLAPRLPQCRTNSCGRTRITRQPWRRTKQSRLCECRVRCIACSIGCRVRCRDSSRGRQGEWGGCWSAGDHQTEPKGAANRFCLKSPTRKRGELYIH